MTDRASQIIKIIQDTPGVQFREVMRHSGLKNGVLSHYLTKLEKSGLIKVLRGPRQTRYFPPQVTEEESIAIKSLRRQTPRDLLLALVEEDGLEFGQLVTKVKKSPSTVSLYLSQLVEDRLVETKHNHLKKRYFIKARLVIDKLIEDYRPTLVERSSSGFEDIINSF